MANFFKNLFNKQSASVIGIDIGSSSIKVVQISRKNGHAVLETYGELALGPYTGKGVGESTNLSTEKIIEAVADVMKEKEVNITTRSCGLAIPFSSSLLLTLFRLSFSSTKNTSLFGKLDGTVRVIKNP